MKQKRIFLVVIFSFWIFCLYLVFRSAYAPESLSQNTLRPDPSIEQISPHEDSFSIKMESLTNESCRSCHSEVYAEWENSFHSKAWSNPDFQAHLNLYRPAECLPCHIPEPLFLRQGTVLQARTQDFESGVSCLTCHLSPQGIATSQEVSKNASHPTFSALELQDDRFCVECHQSIGKTFLQFKQPEQTCRGCHMPAVVRISSKKGFSHRFLEREHPQFMKSALEVTFEQTTDDFTIFLLNSKIPHNIPGERHFRILILFVEIWNTTQEHPLVSYREVIKDISMFRKESLQDKIQPGQKISYRYLKQSGSHVRIRLVYKRFPGELDSEGIEIKQLVMEFKS